MPHSIETASSTHTDFLIIGAGIVGLSMAHELKRRHSDARITILEKETSLGCHASGRNSGVLHAGIYYPEGSLKARVCREGAEELRTYCEERQLPFLPVGKVVLPTSPNDDPQLDVLYQRATANGVEVSYINEDRLRELEPAAKSPTGRALWSPRTGAFEPKAILKRLQEELLQSGVVILFGQKVERIEPSRGMARTASTTIQYGHLFNTAGLHADVIARACGVGDKYRVIPFKGLYYELDPHSGIELNHHVYPVPDLNMPFLGVHFTKGISGTVYLGPTAIPALGRENYRLLQGLEWQEWPEIALHLASLYLRNPQGFRAYSHQESIRFLKPFFAQAAQALVPALKAEHLRPSSKVGIRPQLLDRQSGQLVMDFLVEEGERSTHILNAISPAFTCAFTFARFVLNNYHEWQGMETLKSYANQR